MKKFTLVTLLLICNIAAFCTTWTISASNAVTAFSPSLDTINPGDSVRFSLGTSHNAVEVSQSTWNSNGNTPLAGGFSVGLGGGLVLPAKLTAGTHYYVCQPHANLGMKGKIVVLNTGVNDLSVNELSLVVYPN